MFTEIFTNEFKEMFRQIIKEELALLRIDGQSSVKEQDEMLTIKQASEFLDVPVSTLYNLVSQQKLPALKPGKRLYFLKGDLLEWVKSARKKTIKELHGDADAILTLKKAA